MAASDLTKTSKIRPENEPQDSPVDEGLRKLFAAIIERGVFDLRSAIRSDRVAAQRWIFSPEDRSFSVVWLFGALGIEKSLPSFRRKCLEVIAIVNQKLEQRMLASREGVFVSDKAILESNNKVLFPLFQWQNGSTAEEKELTANSC